MKIIKYLSIFFLLLSLSCNTKVKSEPEKVDLSAIPIVSSVNSTFFLYYFDAGCSFCVAHYERFLKQWRNVDKSHIPKLILVYHSNNKEFIDYYLEKNDINLNGIILFDDYDFNFTETNSFHNMTNSLFYIKHDHIISILTVNDDLRAKEWIEDIKRRYNQKKNLKLLKL